MVIVSALGVSAVALVLLVVAGYGLGRWITPPSLRPYELLLTPLWGYALLVFVAYYGLNSALTLRTALPLALALAAALGALRLVRPGAAGRLPRAPLGDMAAVSAIALLAGLLGVLPLVRAGYLLPIGHGWDIEFYLPLADYLRDYTYAGLHSAPPAPLLQVVDVLPTSARAIGFSYLHGMVDILGGWAAMGTFPLLLALVRGLAVAPVYLMLRVGLRASRGGSLFGALLVASNELLQWISFNSFAMHVSAMALLPLAVLYTLLVFNSRQPIGPTRASTSVPVPGPIGHGAHGEADARVGPTQRAATAIINPPIAGAIVATTALALSYHPALLAYGALAAGIGAWALLALPDRVTTVLRGAAIVLGCLLLGWLAHLRAPRAFFDVYAAQTPSIGGDRFARLTELFGVETFHHLAIAVDQPAWVSALGSFALVLLGVGVVVALWRGVDRGPALGMLVFALLYGLGLRWVIHFAYGYYKGVSYLSFVPLGIAGVGLIEALGVSIGRTSRVQGPRSTTAGSKLERSVHRLQALTFDLRPVTVVVAAGAIVVVCAMTAWSSYRLQQTYRGPVLAGGDVAALASALREIGGDGTVELVDHPELRGPPLGIVSQGLYGHPWVGRGRTGFTTFNRQLPGQQPQYALMHVSEDPRAWGFGEEVVRAGNMVLYRAPAGATAFVSGNPAARTPATGSLAERLDSLEVQNLAFGNHLVATPDQALSLYAAGDRLAWEPLDDDGNADASRVLTLEVASPEPQAITVAGPAQLPPRIEVPAGVSRVALGPISVPAQLAINAEAAPLVVRSAQLWQPDTAFEGVQPLDDELAIATVTSAAETSSQTRLHIAATHDRVLRIGLELYEISELAPRRYAGGVLGVRANEPATLALDLQAPAATLNGGAVPLVTGELIDGDYFASLWVYDGAALSTRVPFVRFSRRDGRVTDIRPLDANATFARLRPSQQPADAVIGPARLTGTRLEGSPAPGGNLELELDWQVAEPAPGEPLLVFAQLLGDDGHRWASWDGAAGGDWWVSPAWQVGDTLRQAIPLHVDEATPPGRYQLVIGLYTASDGRRRPVTGAGAAGDMLVLREVEIR